MGKFLDKVYSDVEGNALAIWLVEEMELDAIQERLDCHNTDYYDDEKDEFELTKAQWLRNVKLALKAKKEADAEACSAFAHTLSVDVDYFISELIERGDFDFEAPMTQVLFMELAKRLDAEFNPENYGVQPIEPYEQ